MADSADAIDDSWRIMAGKFRRYHGISKWIYLKDPRIMLRNFRDFFYFIIGFLQSVWLLVWWRPDVLFVKGGFVGLPVGLAAAVLHIPVVTHDSDTVPGLTNRILSRHARFMAVAMPPEHYRYPKERMRYTGLPIRPEFVPVTPKIKRTARQKLGIPESAFVVAVFGGSLGAVRLNNAIISISAEFLTADENRWLLHQTGSFQKEEIDQFYDEFDEATRSRVKTWSFLEDMHSVTAAADIVVSRAGSSVHEFGAQQKAVILVPNPILTGGHQTVNAAVLAKHQAAVVVTERELTESRNEQLLTAINALSKDTPRRVALGQALAELVVPNAAAKIVAVLEEAVQ